MAEDINEEGLSIAERLARAPKGRDVFDDVRLAMGLPPRPSLLRTPPEPWTEEEASNFERLINEMFERVP